MRGSTRSACFTKSTREENVSRLLTAISTTVCGASGVDATESGIKSPSILWIIPLFARISVVTMFSPFT